MVTFKPALVDKTLTGRRLNVFKSLQALQESMTAFRPGAVSNIHINFQTDEPSILVGRESATMGLSGHSCRSLRSRVLVDGRDESAEIPLAGVIPGRAGNILKTLQVTIPLRHTSGINSKCARLITKEIARHPSDVSDGEFPCHRWMAILT